MIRAAALLAAAALAACGPLPPARPAPSGYTSTNGGAEAYMHNAPRGITNFPYQPPP